jgi:glycerate kinase
MRIVIAPQEFIGTLTAAEAAMAMAEGVRRAVPEAGLDTVSLSDGGPGLVDAILSSRAGHLVRTLVHDPLGRPVEAAWALLDDGAAVIEMAAAAGLTLLREDERHPRITTTYGVGEMVRAALDAGARRLIIGVGGSATNDGGTGMASALGVRFLDAEGRELPPGGGPLAALDRIDITGIDPRVRQAEAVAATDVRNPLCGPEGASIVYGPQKGASPDVARELDAALSHYARVVERDQGVSIRDIPGSGAAGGLGAGLIAFLGAEIRSGFDIVAETVSLRERLRGADLLLTGEGRLDRQTAYGKAVARVAAMARKEGVPVVVIAGSRGEGWEEVLAIVETVDAVVGDGVTMEDAVARPRELLARTVERAVREWLGDVEPGGRP